MIAIGLHGPVPGLIALDRESHPVGGSERPRAFGHDRDFAVELGTGMGGNLYQVAATSQSSASAGKPRAEAAVTDTQPCRRAKIIPWVEFGAPTQSQFEYGLAALRVWRRVTDTAIVTTIPRQEHLYPRLRQRLPGMRIIPGLQTYPRLAAGEFDSIAAWRQLALDVTAFCSASGEKVVVLENEIALRGYEEGQHVLDHERLRACLRQLPREVEIWWYPAFFGESEQNQEFLVATCQAIEQSCRVRFIEPTLDSPAAPRYHAWNVCQAKLERIASRPTIPIAYFGTFPTTGVSYWPYERAPEVLELARGAEVIFYPPYVSWVEAAEAISRAVARPRSGELP